MATSQSTPRILPRHLSSFSPSSSNKVPVRILGKVTSISSDQVTLTCDIDAQTHETVTCLINRDSHLAQGTYYEVIGKVVNLEGGQGLGLKVLTATEWKVAGGKVDMKVYEAVVDATFKYKEIFLDEEVR